MARQVLENGVILPAEYSDDWYDDMTSNLTKLDDVIGSDSEKLSSADVGAAALSNNYNDLDNLPTIPTVNDATLTIQKNGVNLQTFTANASSNVTANITVPTKTSDLTNDSNFVDISNAAVSSGITSAKVTSYDAHIADNDIHVTTADKTSWNTVTSKANDSDVVHKSGDETVAGNKNFEGILSTQPISTLWTETTHTTDDITMLGSNAIHVEQKNSGKLTDLSGGAWTVAELGVGCFFFRINNGADIRYKNFAQNTVNRILVVSGANRFINNLTPDQDNTYNLGDSTRRWKSINNLNPGSLSFPDFSNAIDISSYITVNGRNKESLYTPPANGWLSVALTRTGGPNMAVMLKQGNFASSGNNIQQENGTTTCNAMLPVKGGVQVSINSALADGIAFAYFYPCLGNV